MRVAVVGAGIAGIVAAWHLHRAGHDIAVYEAGEHIGGHTHTHDIELGGRAYAVDTGFIVFNDRTYPRFVALLDELHVPSKASAMSFSMRCERTGLEYNGSTLNGLFAQRRNLLRSTFLRMIAEILRFNREAPQILREQSSFTLGDYLEEGLAAFDLSCEDFEMGHL